MPPKNKPQTSDVSASQSALSTKAIKIDLDLLTQKKLKVEISKVRLEIMVLILGLLFAISFSMGGWLLFTYFFRQNFNSGGLSVSDTLSFAQLSFGFTATIVAMLIYGTLAGYPIARTIMFLVNRVQLWYQRNFGKNDEEFLWRQENGVGSPTHFEWKQGESIFLIFGVLALLVFFPVFFKTPSGFKKLLIASTGAGTWLSLFVFGKFKQIYCPWKPDISLNPIDSWIRNLPKIGREWVIASIVCTSIIGLVFGQTQDASLLAIGVRKLDVSLQLNKDDFSRILRAATNAGIVVNKCESIDLEYPHISHVDVQWSKFGTVGLISFPAEPFGAENKNEKALNQMEVELSNSTFTTIKYRSKLANCEEFLSDYLFDESGKKLTSLGMNSLFHDLNWISSIGREAHIHISAHAGTSKKQKIGNQEKEQLNVVRSYLSQAFRINENQIVTDDAVETESKLDCKTIDDGVGKKLCDKINRRIIISSY